MSQSPSTTAEQDQQQNVSVRNAKPALYRTAISVAGYLFLVYFSYALTFTPLAELFVQRMCAMNGLDIAHCVPFIDGKKNPKYDLAQKDAASIGAVYTLVTGVPPVITCAFFGCIGDAYGRRLPLLLPLIASTLQGVAWAATPSNNDAIFCCTPLAFFGGCYVSNLAAFSVLADVTQDASPKERAMVFGLSEGFIWLGLLLGPIIGGLTVSVIGSQAAFWPAVALGVLNIVIVFFTFPETLEKSRRRAFSWRRANPFASVGMFIASRSTVLLAVILLLGLTAQGGGVANLSIYALKVANLTPTFLGLLQSTVLGASVVGLMIAMPLLLRCVALPRLLVLSCLDAVICWSLMSLVTLAWQLYAVAAGLFLAALFFPIVRCGMTNTFGKERYGEALAAVGVVEQLSSMIGTPIVNGVYQATVSTQFALGSLRVQSIACLTVAAMYLIAAIAGLFVKDIPHEEESDSALGSLISDCRDGIVSGVPHPV